jgi:predicted tellurium resistance membrane protein TerC
MSIAETLSNPGTYLSLLTLSAMEIVLGIDNIVFLSILVGRLPPAERARTRRTGLILALAFRIGLLLALQWIMGLTAPLFAVADVTITGRSLILLGGGLFLIAKSTHEVHSKLEGDDDAGPSTAADKRRGLALVLLQLIAVDLVFSLDSVITAVGMANDLGVMIAAMVVSMLVMLMFAGAVGDFVERHPTVKMLALSFLILIGVMLTAEGLGQHINKGYIYFAMAFSLGVEMLNLRERRGKAVHLRGPHLPSESETERVENED